MFEWKPHPPDRDAITCYHMRHGRDTATVERLRPGTLPTYTRWRLYRLTLRKDGRRYYSRRFENKANARRFAEQFLAGADLAKQGRKSAES